LRRADGRRQMADGKWQTANGKRQMADGKRQTANGRRQTADGKWQTANGRRQTANGRRQTADGKRQTANGRRIDRVIYWVFCFIAFKGFTFAVSRLAFHGFSHLPFHVCRFTDFMILLHQWFQVRFWELCTPWYRPGQTCYPCRIQRLHLRAHVLYARRCHNQI
jgi:uncharacterized protein YjbJ (UPF0337 family)